MALLRRWPDGHHGVIAGRRPAVPSPSIIHRDEEDRIIMMIIAPRNNRKALLLLRLFSSGNDLIRPALRHGHPSLRSTPGAGGWSGHRDQPSWAAAPSNPLATVFSKYGGRSFFSEHARPRHASRFPPLGVSLTPPPGWRRATLLGPASANLHKLGSPGAQLGSPLYPQEQTSPSGPVRSEKCQAR